MDKHNPSEKAALRRNAVVRTWVLGGSLVVFGLLRLLKRGEGFEGPVAPFAAAWALGAAVNFGLAYFSVRRRFPCWIFLAEKTFDILLTAVLSALTGGAASPLTALFFLVAFSSQVDLSRVASHWVQAGSVAACLGAELFSAGPAYADYGAWATWSVVFLVVTFAGAGVIAPSRREAERYERLQAFRRDADALLSGGQETADFPGFLLNRLVELFGFQHGALLRFDESSRELLLKASVNIPPDGRALLFRQTVGPNAPGVGVYAAHEKRTTFLREPASNPKLPPILRRVFEDAGSDRLASVPMVQGGDLIGVALLSSAGGAKKVEDEEVELLEFACGLIGGYLTRWEKKSADSRKPTT